MSFISTVLVCVSDGHCAIDFENREKDTHLFQSLAIQARSSFSGVEGDLHIAFVILCKSLSYFFWLKKWRLNTKRFHEFLSFFLNSWLK